MEIEGEPFLLPPPSSQGGNRSILLHASTYACSYNTTRNGPSVRGERDGEPKKFRRRATKQRSGGARFQGLPFLHFATTKIARRIAAADRKREGEEEVAESSSDRGTHTRDSEALKCHPPHSFPSRHTLEEEERIPDDARR